MHRFFVYFAGQCTIFCTRCNWYHYEHWMGIIFSLFLMVTHFVYVYICRPLNASFLKLTICRQRQCSRFILAIECRFWHKCKDMRFTLKAKQRRKKNNNAQRNTFVSRSKWNKAHENGWIFWSRTTTYICFRLMISSIAIMPLSLSLSSSTSLFTFSENGIMPINLFDYT